MARVTTKGKELVLTVYSSQDADSACAELLKADIDYVRRKIGAGDFGNILMSMRNFGEEIFVLPEDVDRAKEVLDVWRKKAEQKAAEAAKEVKEVTPQDKKQIMTARVVGTIALIFILVYYFMTRV